MFNDACYPTYPLDDFQSVLRMIGEELKKFALSTMTLLCVLFSTVNVTARLAECVLNVAIGGPADAACPRQPASLVKALYNRHMVRSVFTAAAAVLLLWLYINTVVGPVYLLVAGSALSAVQLCGSVVAAVLASAVRWGKVFL